MTILVEKSLYINGEWYTGQNTKTNINPSDITDNLGEFSQASKQQVIDAIEAAKCAQPKWESTPLEHKKGITGDRR